jgi:hypothetical protein
VEEESRRAAEERGGEDVPANHEVTEHSRGWGWGQSRSRGCSRVAMDGAGVADRAGVTDRTKSRSHRRVMDGPNLSGAVTC